ncbi:MAG: sugar/nucleoside kinase (ribokinase family) [Cocleimonas sp.]|jgi:sugar/nucleoside kinase (ribokinase family)
MTYQVYGIGNALVDAEFEVTDSFLKDHSIEKGLMTLIDEDQQHKLVTNLNEKFGLKKRAGGGSAANTLVAISQLGGNTFYACKVADDETGEFYMKDLALAGVETKLDQVKEDGVTGKCLVMVTEDAERTMNTFLGITADFSESDLHLEELVKSEYIYIEGYLVTSDVSRNAAINARKVAKDNNVKTAFTFSDPAMVTYFKEGVSEIIGDGVDVLFSNEEEALTYSDKDTLDEAITELLKITKKLVITLGSKGARVVNPGNSVNIDPVKVEAIDTNGAGDMFAGAFMYGLTNKMSDQQAGNLASESAANIVTIFGARLDKKTQQEILAKHS